MKNVLLPRDQNTFTFRMTCFINFLWIFYTFFFHFPVPAVEELPMMSANERARKMAIQSPNKHKGVYAYN